MNLQGGTNKPFYIHSHFRTRSVTLDCQKAVTKQVYISSVLSTLTTISLEAIVSTFLLQLKGTGVVLLRQDVICNKAANSTAIIMFRAVYA